MSSIEIAKAIGMTIEDMPMEGSISQRILTSLIGHVVFGRPPEDAPMPHGPADPVIFSALQKTLWALGNPIPWRLGPTPEPWIQAGLNPQPLPPRTLFFAAIADQVIDRALLIQETADALRSQGESQGIIIVSGYISKFADEFELCPRIPWPHHWPRPHWLPEQPGGADLIVTGVQFGRAGSQTFDGELKQSLADAGAKLVQSGLAKLQ